MKAEIVQVKNITSSGICISSPQMNQLRLICLGQHLPKTDFYIKIRTHSASDVRNQSNQKRFYCHAHIGLSHTYRAVNGYPCTRLTDRWYLNGKQLSCTVNRQFNFTSGNAVH